MKNIIEFIKDKSYYFLGGTIIIIILIIIVNACSSNFSSGSYESIENEMISAAKEYYSKKSNLLPQTDGGSVKVTISSLVESELLDEIYDIEDSSKKCTGYVEVTKVETEYSYMPFLKCEGSYEPEYLTDKIKESKLDEYGNGVYLINNEYVYRGEDVDNYINFNNELWRIVKIDLNGDIKIVKANHTDDYYLFDDAYNSYEEEEIGIVTNYLQTDIRKSLVKYYKEHFTKESKSKIVSKDLCVGSYLPQDEFSVEKECSVLKEDEKVSLLSPTDFQLASLSTECVRLDSEECINYNYLSNSIYTWLLNYVTNTTYKVFYLNRNIKNTYASNEKPINPVVYLNNKVITVEGTGTLKNPYVIK